MSHSVPLNSECSGRWFTNRTLVDPDVTRCTSTMHQIVARTVWLANDTSVRVHEELARAEHQQPAFLLLHAAAKKLPHLLEATVPENVEAQVQVFHVPALRGVEVESQRFRTLELDHVASDAQLLQLSFSCLEAFGEGDRSIFTESVVTQVQVAEGCSCSEH